jgi:hypothetical protein
MMSSGRRASATGGTRGGFNNSKKSSGNNRAVGAAGSGGGSIITGKPAGVRAAVKPGHQPAQFWRGQDHLVNNKSNNVVGVLQNYGGNARKEPLRGSLIKWGNQIYK